MVVSHKYKFIFIKTTKTAGTSIEVYLSGVCAETDVFTPIYPVVEPHRPRNYAGFWNPFPELTREGWNSRAALGDLFRRRRFFNHISASTVLHRISEPCREYYTFCVERNPWDKTVSGYKMQNERAGGLIDFADYIDAGAFPNDFAKYTDRSGNLIVDRVLRYESLNQELADVFGGLGVPFPGSLGIRAKSDHARNEFSYRSFFNPRLEDAVGAAFAKEIRMHGYTF